MVDAAANAAGTVLLAYVMIRLGFRARASHRVWDAHARGLGRRCVPTRRGSTGAVVATGIGVAEGIAVLVGMGLVSPYLPQENVKEPAPWMGFLASVSAGVTEEILFRLGLMTSLAWLLTVLTRRGTAGPVIVLVANVLAALAFAALHLPQAKAFYGLSALMVLVVMIGNGVPGVIFGWLFRRFGLITAMVAHFSVDVVLHVIGPMIG